MGWRTHYFGNENPTLGRRVVHHSMIAVLALAAYGYWNDFIPDDWLPWWGLGVSAVLAALLTGWLAWRLLCSPRPGYAVGRSELVLLLPLTFAAAGGFLWMALVHGAAGAYTRLFGVTHAEVVTLRLERQYGRQCHYQAEGWRLEQAMPGHLCVRSSYYASFPGHRVEMELRGQRSLFGFNVSGTHHRADLDSGLR
ncbi:hypothetical protein [Dyella amyloliquefaciens]|uniref:hypothetical protein n=1 Tax=Dyella amyloliquefaciens TaxID=1770545 RepID=UPI00102EAA74|nr:hypothetical protein [Dyella amyloliquefaciens]